MIAPRRNLLDEILVDAAVEAGAELPEEFVVRELLSEGDRVNGIKGQPKDGSPTTEEWRSSEFVTQANAGPEEEDADGGETNVDEAEH